MADYYEILGVAKGATPEEIKKAYYGLAHKYHPHKAGGNEAKFKEINEAYQTLSNPEKRAQYDRFGKNYNGAGGAGFGGGQGFGGFGQGGFGFDVNGINMDDLGDVGDIFETFFGGGRGRSRQTRDTSGSDLKIMQTVSLEEAFTGATKELKFTTLDSCKSCSGLGYEKSAGVKKCEDCKGSGEVKESRRTVFGTFAQSRVCNKCIGKGEIPNKICNTCKGDGRVSATRTLKVEIIPGVSDGQMIKIAGAGEAGERGGESGDLYVQIRISHNSHFERVGDDLVVKKEIGPLEILLGKKIAVPVIGGGQIEVEIPAGFNFATRLRIESKGMPIFGTRNRHGDLYVEFHVKAPKKISGKLRKALEEVEGEAGS
jgi:molecular chaperone DnaJ